MRSTSLALKSNGASSRRFVPRRLTTKLRAQILERLSAHTFANRDHEIIFQALAKMPPATAEHIRETLSARLTRLGFPDIDVEPIFEFSPPPPDTITALLQKLDR